MAQGRPDQVEALFSQPRILCNIWSLLDPHSRSQLQGADFYLHSDTRWFLLGQPPIIDVQGRGDEAAPPTAAQAQDQEEPPGHLPLEPDLQALDVYSIMARTRTHEEDTPAVSIVKRYRKSGAASDAASSVAAPHSHTLPASSKVAPAKPCPFPAGTPRLGNPPARVSDLPFQAANVAGISHRPRFTVKYPSHKPGTPKPPPVFSKKHSISAPPPPPSGASPVLRLGGIAVA